MKKIFLILFVIFITTISFAKMKLDNNNVVIDTTSITTGQLISTATYGTAPLVVTSSSMVTNLNANYLGGYSASSLVLPSNSITGTGVLNYLPLFNSTGTLTSSVISQSGNNINITGAVVTSTASAFTIGSGFSDGNYINIGTVRKIGVFNGGNLFMGYNANYDATNNTYTKEITDESAVLEYTTAGDFEFKISTSATAGTTYTPTTVMKIGNNGRIGLGTNAPSQKLQIHDGNILMSYSDWATIDQSIQIGTTRIMRHLNTLSLQSSSDGVNFTTGLNIVSNGNAGLGTSDPGIANLYVSNNMSNIGVYIGTGTPSGQAKLEMDGGAGTHIWIAEGGIPNSVFVIGSGGTGYFKGKLSVNNEINSKIKSLTVNVNVDTKISEISSADAGKLFIVKAISTNNKLVGIFELSLVNGVGYTATKVSGTLFSGTKDNASTVNVYWQSLGDAGFYVQNKLSENITVTIGSYTPA